VRYLRSEVEQGWPCATRPAFPTRSGKQIEHELALIAELQYEAYFLTVYDIVKFARSRGILCQGRGSAANSAVCYALGITEVDPAPSSAAVRALHLEGAQRTARHRRRLRAPAARGSHPVHLRQIRPRARRAGGHRHPLPPRSALRDTGRALGIDLDRIDALTGVAGLVGQARSMPERFAAVGLDPASPRVEKWLILAEQLRGFPRHLSQHVGGFVISRGRLDRLVPIENAAMEARSVIQWDKDDIDALGLMKVDVLALGMLTAIRRALDAISQRAGASSACRTSRARTRPPTT
jgi:error-prone DNA polymerase